MRFDVLVKGGQVVDPATDAIVRADVAVKRDRIAAVDRDIPAASAFRVIDATEQYVTPGLVDLNATVDWLSNPRGVNPDLLAPRTGVTTWIDAGSVGPLNLDPFREQIVRPSTVRMRAFLRLGPYGHSAAERSEERRVGKEWRS